jgi:3-oxoacyl-[acyl-carrier-protein] synthase II
VVTGVGLVCGLGIGTDEVWKNLLAGKSGIRTITHFDAAAFDCTIAGEVRDFDPLHWAEKKELKKIAEILSGHETGLREIHDIAIVSQLVTILALDPEVGSRQQADKLIASFRGDAAKLADPLPNPPPLRGRGNVRCSRGIA